MGHYFGALLQKWCPKGTDIVPLYKTAPFLTFFAAKIVPFIQGHQNNVIFQKGTIFYLFFATRTVPSFLRRRLFVENGASRALFWKTLPFWWGHFWCIFQYKEHFFKWFPNMPKGTVLAPFFFLGEVPQDCLTFRLICLIR